MTSTMTEAGWELLIGAGVWEAADHRGTFMVGASEGCEVNFVYEHLRQDCAAVLWKPFSGLQPDCTCGLPARKVERVLRDGVEVYRMRDPRRPTLLPGDSLRLHTT